MVCDARTYGKLLREPKGYYVQTLWNADSAMDPAVPGFAETVLQYNTVGNNLEQSSQHSPLLQAWHELLRDEMEDNAHAGTENDYIQHSAGLIRNWLYGSSSTDNWPQWTSEERVGCYGFEQYDTHETQETPMCFFRT